MKEILFHNFSMYYPNSAKKVVNYYVDNITGELVLVMKDGHRFVFDEMMEYNKVKHISKNIFDATDEDVKNDFSIRLIKIMNMKNITQQQLSELANISQSTLSSYITKRSMPSIKNANRIAYVLGYTIEDLFYYK